MLENVPASFEPMPFTMPMMTTEMPAAMRPYSMAVAPFSFRVKLMTLDISCTPGEGPVRWSVLGLVKSETIVRLNDERVAAGRCASLQLALDARERGRQLRTDSVHDGDDRDRDAGRDEPVLDGGCP